MNKLEYENCRRMLRQWRIEDGQNENGKFVEEYLKNLSVEELEKLSEFCSRLIHIGK